MTNRLTAFRISQGNPKGRGQGDLPTLLRTFADTIESLGSIEVLDLVLEVGEVNEFGVWPAFTLYYDEQRGEESAVQ